MDKISDSDNSKLRYIAAVTQATQAVMVFERTIHKAVTKCIPFVPPCPACGERMTEEHAKFVDPEEPMEILLQAAERRVTERMRPVLRAIYGHRTTCKDYADYEIRSGQREV